MSQAQGPNDAQLTPLPAAIEIAPYEEDTEGADSWGRSVRAAIVASFA